MNCGNALDKFQSIAKQMLEDLRSVPHNNRLAQVYNADSRKRTIILVIVVVIYVSLHLHILII